MILDKWKEKADAELTKFVGKAVTVKSLAEIENIVNSIIREMSAEGLRLSMFERGPLITHFSFNFETYPGTKDIVLGSISYNFN